MTGVLSRGEDWWFGGAAKKPAFLRERGRVGVGRRTLINNGKF